MIEDKNNIKFDLEPSLFWETDITQMDFIENSTYIIGRVLMYGNLKDWFSIKKYFGEDKIKETALKIRYLDRLTLNFCSMYFDIPKENFRCYNTPQSVKELWDY